jgi:fructose-1,6-bisphosphatase/inositol monophosphatase family enzyme
MHTLHTLVSDLMRRVATSVVMPRFRQLAADEIEEKSPGDLVTIADRESEVRLTEGLAKILPNARTVGEEACSADPTLLENLNQGTAWIVDPIDGTSNFAAGNSPFALMIGLVADGETLAGWILDPVSDRMCHAVRGGGAFVDDHRVVAQETGAILPRAGISTYFMAASARETFLENAAGKMTLADIPRCAGEQYPRLVLGQHDLALFERVLPWDHIPGALFLTEAGGHIARLDGTPYRFWDGRTGLLAAASRRVWDNAAEILNG